jgi:drug/metabolite transporter (DMT)-like permease
VLLLGVVNNAAPWTLLAWAQQTLPSGLAGLLMAIVPTSTLLVAAAVGLERITRTRLVGLLLALGGVAVIVAGDLEQPGRVLAVARSCGDAAVRDRRGARQAAGLRHGAAADDRDGPGPRRGGGQPAGRLADLGPGHVRSRRGDHLARGALLGMFGTGLAFLVFYVLVERVGATNATLTTYLIPIVAVLGGALLLDERLGLGAVVGGALILLGIWLAQRTPAAPTPARHAPPAG